MAVLFIIAAIIFVLFVFVIAFGAPFLPTLNDQVDKGLDLLDLQPGQTMVEPGSGDGRVLIAAAKRGINGVGYELNPLLVIYSRMRTWRYRSHITIHWGSFWSAQWPETDGVYLFLMTPFMPRMHTKLTQVSANRPLKVVSFAYEITGKKHIKKVKGMFLYKYS